jgi:hypothetical protein
MNFFSTRRSFCGGSDRPITAVSPPDAPRPSNGDDREDGTELAEETLSPEEEGRVILRLLIGQGQIKFDDVPDALRRQIIDEDPYEFG